MKRDYTAPETTAIDLEVERGFEASGQWYQSGGEGNFNYETETEDTWK